jgi:hypothetical protein
VYDYDICISTKVKILSETMLCNFIEWLEYHYLLGVDQVFIMEDCCEVEQLGETMHILTASVSTRESEFTSSCRSHLDFHAGSRAFPRGDRVLQGPGEGMIASMM